MTNKICLIASYADLVELTRKVKRETSTIGYKWIERGFWHEIACVGREYFENC